MNKGNEFFWKHCLSAWVALPVVLSLFVSSCCTQALWDATDPNEYVRLSDSSLSAEDLRNMGIPFRAGYNGRYYIPKSGLRKLSDYTLRTFGTPVAVAVDSATTIVVVGVVVVISAAGENAKKGSVIGFSGEL